MQLQPTRGARRALLALLLAAAPAAAQSGLSGSQNYVMASRATAAASAAASSESYRGLLGAGLASSSESASSESYELVAGLMAFDGSIAPGPPVLFALSPALADAAGGETLTLTGIRLDDGTQTAIVQVGSSLAMDVDVQSGAQIQATTPPGWNAFGNPLGATTVSLANVQGTDSLEEELAYTPALLQDTVAKLGEPLLLSFHAAPGSYHQVSLGAPFGFGLAIPPISGSLEINPILQVSPFEPSATGHLSMTLEIPDEPSLAGKTLYFQDFALTSFAPLLEGQFTNVLEVTILP